MAILDRQKITGPVVTNINHEALNRTWIEIDRHALEHNIASFKAIVKPSLLAIVIKSNAYGHGIEVIAKTCDQNDAVDMLCTVSISEALFLRNVGIKKSLLVLSMLDGDLDKAISENIDLVVFDIKTAIELNQIAQTLNKKVNVHIKVDTGLSRLGLPVNDALIFIKQIQQLPFICIRGIFSHFADSENEDQSFAHQQLNQFKNLLNALEFENIDIALKHISCSASTTSNLNSHHNMVRVGISAYGLWPSTDNKNMAAKSFSNLSIKPILTWKTKIIQIKEIPAGSYVGYDRTFQAKVATKIATLPIGYWDGYSRKLSNRSKVLINNQYAQVVGIVAMNLTMVDVTGLNVSVGDEAILLGNHPLITAEDLANHCDTINYEIVARINPLIPRIAKD